MIVTLEKQKKENRFNLFVDGEFYSGINLDQIVKYDLKNGCEIEKEKLDEIVLESESFYAFNKVLKYISKSMKTEHDLLVYLKQKSFRDDVIKKTIEKLKEYNYVNDEIYVKSYVETYKSKFGESRLRQNLKNKNIDEELIEKYLILDERDVIFNIKKEILKQTKNKVLDAKQKQKIYRNLAFKGYSFEQIKNAFNTLGEDDENWD
ncbi:MAG: RecX family transcriptional regulator [Christensenellales bacterium]